jgi:hypothetical protein
VKGTFGIDAIAVLVKLKSGAHFFMVSLHFVGIPRGYPPYTANIVSIQDSGNAYKQHYYPWYGSCIIILLRFVGSTFLFIAVNEMADIKTNLMKKCGKVKVPVPLVARDVPPKEVFQDAYR